VWSALVPQIALIFAAMHKINWTPPVCGHTSLFADSVHDLVPPEALKNVYGTYLTSMTWTDTEKPGPKQQAFADLIVARAAGLGGLGGQPPNALAPFYDWLQLIKMVIEDEKTFDTDRIKQALDSVKNYDGVEGKLSLSPDYHTALSDDGVTMARLGPANDPRAKIIFRERAS
jgi:branched-chain amino acid transport system substrate-binding protein